MKAAMLDAELLEHVCIATNATEEAVHCIESHVDSLATHTETFPLQRIGKGCSHSNEPGKTQ
jgi:hypothetical protein